MYYADEFNLSWMPTLRALWSPIGQQIMIPTPGSPKRGYGIGAVNYWTGETQVLLRPRKRRAECVELLQALLEHHPSETIYVVWDNASAHRGGAIADLVTAAQGRLVLLYLPTYSPWLNPIEMLWRHFRRVVTHCEFFPSFSHLLTAAETFFTRLNLHPHLTRSIIGSLSS